jgi:Arm domain-containing DNA-binding protein
MSRRVEPREEHCNVTTNEGRRRGLTEEIIRKAAPVDGRRLVLRDAGQHAGLELRVTANGIKTFSYLYRNRHGRRRRFTIGRHGEGLGEFTLANARKAFRKGIGRTAEGADPQAEKRAAATGRTIGDLFEACCADVWAGKSCEPKNRGLYRRHIAPAIVGDGERVESMRAAELAEPHIHQILDQARRDASGRWIRGVKTNGHASRNRVLSLLSRMLGYAKGRGYGITANIAAGIERLEEGERESYVKLDKLGAFWRAVGALEDQDIREAMQCVILSAQRNRQIRILDWSWLDWEGEHSVITFPRSAMKAQRQAHVLGLPPLMLEILQKRHERMGQPARGPVFPSANTRDGMIAYNALYDAHVALCKELGLAEPDKRHPGRFIVLVGLHDWRRAFNNLTKRKKGKADASHVSRFDRSKVLHHADPTMTAGAYEDDDGYPEETRAALAVWENVILTAAAGDKVIAFPGKAEDPGAA